MSASGKLPFSVSVFPLEVTSNYSFTPGKRDFEWFVLRVSILVIFSGQFVGYPFSLEADQFGVCVKVPKGFVAD